MKKPEGLGRLLLQTVPGLADEPGRLQIFVDQGRVAARPGSLSFEYRYTLNIVITDFAGDQNAIIVPILAWVAEMQPDLLERPDAEPFSFSAEILDDKMCDVSIDLQLTEAVRVETEGQGWAATHLDEPAAAGDDFPGACGATLWQLFLRDVLIAETSDPDFVPPAP